MAKQSIALVSDRSDRFKTAQEALNNNFDEIYAALPPTSLSGQALKYVRVKADESGLEYVTGGGGGIAGDGIAKITVGTSAPVSPSPGDLWIDTSII